MGGQGEPLVMREAVLVVENLHCPMARGGWLLRHLGTKGREGMKVERSKSLVSKPAVG